MRQYSFLSPTHLKMRFSQMNYNSDGILTGNGKKILGKKIIDYIWSSVDS